MPQLAITGTQQLIGFIIDQELNLEEYKDKLPSKIHQHFEIINNQYDTPYAVEALVGEIVDWEKGKQSSSLEKYIDENYTIKMIKDWKERTPAVVINIPDKDIARIRKETNKVAGVINREMIALQRKFPDHFFEMAFEFQRLGKQKFYKIHLKTFKDE